METAKKKLKIALSRSNAEKEDSTVVHHATTQRDTCLLCTGDKGMMGRTPREKAEVLETFCTAILIWFLLEFSISTK